MTKNSNRIMAAQSHSAAPCVCTKEMFNAILDNETVKYLINCLKNLPKSMENYKEEKASLKGKLPVFCFQMSDTTSGRRCNAEAIESGLAMVDVDGVENPDEWWRGVDEETLKTHHVCLVHKSPSGHGVRIVVERLKKRNGSKETIEEARWRAAVALGFVEIDACTKDLARCSYVVCRDYVYYVNEKMLLEMPVEVDLIDEEFDDSVPFSVSSQETCANVDIPYIYNGVSSVESCPRGLVDNLAQQTYEGMDVKDIMEELKALGGFDKEVVEGQRNNCVFYLANNLRYILEFDYHKLLNVIPNFGLPLTEYQAAVKSGLGGSRLEKLPSKLVQAIKAAKQNKETEKEIEESHLRQADLRIPSLPPLLKIICESLPDEFKAPMLASLLPVLGALATNVRFKYGKNNQETHSFSFMTVVCAPFASGKSFAKPTIKLLLKKLREDDAQAFKAFDEYKEAMRRLKNNKKQPEKPQLCIRNIGSRVSPSALLELLKKANGKHLIHIDAEIDALAAAQKSEVNISSDIHKKAFDNDDFEQIYKGAEAESGCAPIYLNMLYSGTPKAVNKYFGGHNIGNGLVSRVMFVNKPCSGFEEEPDFKPYSEMEELEILRWANKLMQEDGFIECDAIKTRISKWLAEKRGYAKKMDSRAIKAFSHRAGVIGCRAGMLSFILWGRPQGAETCEKCADFAEWAAEYTLRGQMELFGAEAERQLTDEQQSGTTTYGEASLYDVLPEKFTKHELKDARERFGAANTNGAIDMCISRWRKEGIIAKGLEAGIYYRKIS